LRRVPPNLLIAEGAADFAWEHGINIVHHDALVSKNARDRFLRWREDLRRAGGVRVAPGTPSSTGSAYGDDIMDIEYEERARSKERRDHFNALLTGTWNEGQVDSPSANSPSLAVDDSTQDTPYFSPDTSGSVSRNSPTSLNNMLVQSTPSSTEKRPVSPFNSRSPGSRSQGSPSKRARYLNSRSSDSHSRVHSLLGPGDHEASKTSPATDTPSAVMGETRKALIDSQRRSDATDGSADDSSDYYTSPSLVLPSMFTKMPPPYQLSDIDEDIITDTVGAIAIDMFGNIAAGSSSGGIGMKHRGRVGPAALVGVGTAVIPADPNDPDSVCVAAVTSGTGEHMATTMASQKCAERLYYSTKRSRGGGSLATTEEEAMESFVRADFMDHPGVKNSHSAGAIGVMAVKKTPWGIFLHFAHNTDSFALASHHSNEKEPKCVMSRIGDHGSIVQGGRKVRVG
jgi:taspase (threonine aspartase 1)